MKTVISLIVLLIAIFTFAEDKSIYISYEDGLAQGWVNKVQEGVNTTCIWCTPSETNYHSCYWVPMTNAVGAKIYGVIVFDSQLKNAGVTGITDIVGHKVPKPFLDKIVMTETNFSSRGFYPVVATNAIIRSIK